MPIIPASDTETIPSLRRQGSAGAFPLGLDVHPGISSLSEPLFIAHRGGSIVSPEHTLKAYRLISRFPSILIEADVVVLGDDSQACMHDSTVDRTTTGTGSVVDFDADTWLDLRMRQAVEGGVYSVYDIPPARFDDVLREFGNRRVLVVEVKTSGAGQLMADTLLAYGISPDHVIVTASNDDALQPSLSAGYLTMYAVNSEHTPAGVLALGHAWVSLPDSVTEARIQEFQAVGIKCAIYAPTSHWNVDKYIGFGANAIFSDDPVYSTRRSVTRATDPYFKLGNVFGAHGRRTDNNTCLSYDTVGDVARLKFTHPDHYVGQLQGWAYPLPESLDLTYSADYIQSYTNETRTCGGYLGTTDFAFTTSGSDPIQQGYSWGCTKAGVLSISRVNAGTSTSLGTQSSTAISNGQTVPFRMRVTATGLELTRLDTGATLSVSDNTYRPLPYFQFGALQLQCAFHTVTVATYVP